MPSAVAEAICRFHRGRKDKTPDNETQSTLVKAFDVIVDVFKLVVAELLLLK